jgi:peptidoglycan hydrolase CwlO-like protein
MTSDDDKAWLMRELDKLNDSVQSVDEKVDDVRERVTRLEASSRATAGFLAFLVAAVPVGFLIFDRVTN